MHATVKLLSGIASALIATAASAEVDHSMSLGVVQVRAYPGGSRVQYGSGVVISKDTVATNCHVTREARKVMVSKGPELFLATRQQADVHKDLCLLTTPGIPFPPVKLGSAKQLTPGQTLYIYGYPRTLGISFSEGKVKSVHDYEGGNIIGTSADFTLGASGGGVFDETGKLVGLATFLTRGHTGGYYAIPADWFSAAEKLSGNDVEPLKGQTFWENKSALPEFLQIKNP